MPEWAWVALGYVIAYGALARYTFSLAWRARAIRRRGGGAR